jgi:hypothetical protein
MFLLLFSSAVAAQSIDECMTGSYYDPANPGEGVNVEVGDDYTIAYFYKFDGTWVAFHGDREGALDAYQNRGEGASLVGEGALEVVDENTVALSWDLLLDIRYLSAARPIPWCLHSECEGDVVFERLTQPIPCAD